MGKRFAPKWYPGDTIKRIFTRRQPAASADKPIKTKLRKGLEPGRVLILLAGRYRGKRVVFLKQLQSGLLLVSGPLKVNGVPLKRVNQVYTVTTSTKVNVSGVNVDNINDDLFKKERTGRKIGAARFFAEKQVLFAYYIH